VDDATGERLRELKQEWTELVARETPPPSDYKTNQQIQAEKAAVKARMVKLLHGFPEAAFK
jgi:hypothetical protein